MPDRRSFLAGTAGLALAGPAATQPAQPTRFQLACMTLPYAQFPLQRALEGIARAGFRFVAWGTEHQEEPGRRVAVMPRDAAPAAAAALAGRCRDMGLEPVMQFSIVYPEHRDGLEVLKRRIEQARAARMPQVLTFGYPERGAPGLWEERFAALAPLAKEAGVTLVIKQHGGSTGTGKACAEFTRRLNHPNVKVNFDAGNVMDYLSVDPIPDLKLCADEVRSFCIKDHRDFPKDEDCGPGFGEIDHYRLLHAVARTGRTMPLCCENIFAPLVPRPASPEGVDALARRAREFMETVIAGIQATG